MSQQVRPRLRMRLGDLLVDRNVITQAQLEAALAEQKETGHKLGRVLVDNNAITEIELLEFLSRQLNVPLINIKSLKLDADIVRILPEKYARRYRAMVIDADDTKATVVLSDPANLQAVDAVNDLLAPRKVEFAAVAEDQLLAAFDNTYRRTQEIDELAQKLQAESAVENEFSLEDIVESDADDDVTVARLIDTIFLDALDVGASDIHIEPDANGLRVRLRVDGQLQENFIKEKNITNSLMVKLKIMASLDISEKRLPQDGRFQMTLNGRKIDIRLSTMPVQYGESCVMRLLDQTQGFLGLEQTGMPAEMVKRFRYHLTRPNGLILVTGPTGSGKTTTLYAALGELNQPEKKIITVEDPVEYRMSRIAQVQVNSQIGLTFARVLRTTLRQDPDIIMVGEMRDQETVEIGLRGSITGHMVFSTLHTNDAMTSAMRLIDMGAAPYLVASALRAVLAQRLIRKVCQSCVKPVEESDRSTDINDTYLIKTLVGDIPSDANLVEATGCQKCNFTGYKGRIGIFELLELDEQMKEALRLSDTQAFAEAVRRNKNFKTLAQSALEHAIEGTTTLAEVISLIGDAPVFDESSTPKSSAPAASFEPTQELASEPLSKPEASSYESSSEASSSKPSRPASSSGYTLDSTDSFDPESFLADDSGQSSQAGRDFDDEGPEREKIF